MVGHDLQLVPELAEIHADVRSRHGQVRAWYTIITVGILEIIRLHISDCKKVTVAASWHKTVSTILTKQPKYFGLLTTF
jgi:hypothetical protein